MSPAPRPRLGVVVVTMGDRSTELAALLASVRSQSEPAERIVLGDWYEQGSVLVVDGERVELRGLATG